MTRINFEHCPLHYSLGDFESLRIIEMNAIGIDFSSAVLSYKSSSKSISIYKFGFMERNFTLRNVQKNNYNSY